MSSPAIDLTRLPHHVRDKAEMLLGHIAQGSPCVHSAVDA